MEITKIIIICRNGKPQTVRIVILNPWSEVYFFSKLFVKDEPKILLFDNLRK